MKRKKIHKILVASLLLGASSQSTIATVATKKQSISRSNSTDSINSQSSTDSTNSWVKVNNSQRNSPLPEGSIGAVALETMTPKRSEKLNMSIDADIKQYKMSLEQLKDSYLQKLSQSHDQGSQIAFQQKINLIDQRLADLNKPQEASLDWLNQNINSNNEELHFNEALQESAPIHNKDSLTPDKRGFMESSNTPEYKNYILDVNKWRKAERAALMNQNVTLTSNNQIAFTGNGLREMAKPAIYQPKSQDVKSIINDPNKTKQEINQKLKDLLNSSTDQQVVTDIAHLNHKVTNGNDRLIEINEDVYNQAQDKLDIAQAQSNITTISENKNKQEKLLWLLNDRFDNSLNQRNTRTNSTVDKLYTIQIEDSIKKIIKDIKNEKTLSLQGKIAKLESLKEQVTKDSSDYQLKKKLNSIGWYDYARETQIKKEHKAESFTGFDETINTLKQDGVSLERLHKDISDLKNDSYNALKNFLTTGSGADFNQFASNSLMALWKRGAVTAKTISQIFSNWFKAAGVKVPEKQVKDLGVDAAADLPPASATPEQQAHWFTRVSQMVTDAIFGTREQQLAKTLSQKHEDIAQKITTGTTFPQKTDLIKKMITEIIEEVAPKLSESDKKYLLDSILQGTSIQENISIQDFPLAYPEESSTPQFTYADPTFKPNLPKQSSHSIKPHESLWENTNRWSIHAGGIDPAKFNAWMTKTVKLIKDKSKTASPAINTTQATI